MSMSDPNSGTGRRVTSAAIVNALPHAVIVLGADDAIIAANDAAQAFFSASLTMLRKRPLEAFVPFGSPLLELPSKVRAANASMVEYRVDLSSPRLGQGQVVDIHAVPLPEDPAIVILTLDRPSMAEKIDRALTSRTAARSVTGLAAMLAHEIRNPLSGIRGAAQLIEPALNEDDRALARLITAETDRIVKLVDRMEVFGDMRPVSRTPVNIHDVLDHVAQLAETGVARHLSVTKQYDPSLPPVNANRDQLVQVFLNLVKNAAEATPAGGQITLTTAYRPGMRVQAPGSPQKISLPLEFCVKDTGPGVPEDLLPHLFEPFVTTKTNGTGLGLALVAKIVGDHGGVVEIEANGGTTVRILMPAFQGDGDVAGSMEGDA